jgi:hypothetical protein
MTLVILSAFIGLGTIAACVCAVLLKRELQRELARLFDGCAEAVR